MRVLVVNPEFYVYGGAERLIVRLCNYLTDKDVKNTLLTFKIPPRIKEKFTETRIIETGNIEHAAPVLQSIVHRFDVVNPHNDPAQLLIYPRMRPTVWMCNEPPIQVLMGGTLNEAAKRVVQRHIDIAVVADEYNKNRFIDVYGVEPRVNNYGVDWQFFNDGSPDEVSEKYGLDGCFTILQVGMFTFTKNQLKTVSILRKIKKQVPEAKLVLAGYNDTPYFESVKRKIIEGGLRRDVVITGEIPQSEVRDLYYASDVLLVPIMPQGGWLSTFEAMVTGLPVVVSSEMTAASVIKENNLGVVSKNYADEVFAVYGKGRRTTEPSRWVKENLTWERFCGNMLKYFEEVAP